LHVGADERGATVVALLDELEEDVRLLRPTVDISELINR
jgi:hypothetical protein